MTGRRSIFNTTLHPPSAEQAAAGVGPPCGREVPLEASFQDVRAVARALVDEARSEKADAVLIGGLSSLVVAVYLEAVRAGMPVVEALTERLRDERGRFVFAHRGLRELPPP